MSLKQPDKNNLKVMNRDIIKYIAIIPMIAGHIVGCLIENVVLGSSTFLTIIQALAIFAPPIFSFLYRMDISIHVQKRNMQ